MGLKQIRHSQREKWWTGKSVRRKHQDETWRDTRMEHTVEGIRDVEDKVRIEVLEGDERENRAGAIIWRENIWEIAKIDEKQATDPRIPGNPKQDK